MTLNESLSDYLLHYGISKKQACKIFDKQPSTIKRWDKNPPHWVINIIKIVGNQKNIPSSWEGWYFKDDKIYDPDGNFYTQSSIRSLYMQNQLSRSLLGDTLEIRSLKTHLLDQLKKQPVLKISLVEQTTETQLQEWSIAL